ncbi:MAG: histidinol-phosphate transaminase [Candidatus Methanomethylophilaceae archaeon]
MSDRDIMRSSVRHFQRYYSPDVGDALRMDTSTNVLGPHPAALAALSDLSDLDLNQYPSTYSDGLRQTLAEKYGLRPDNFVVGAGSDENIDIICKCFMDWQDSAVVPYPSYSLYDFFINMNGGRVIAVELDDEFQLDVDSMVKAKGKVMIMPSPNNPTGAAFREKDIVEILDRFPGIVVVDEAYGEFTGRSMIPRVDEFDNLIVIKTMSKAYALAGLRVGFSASNLKLADMMSCVKIPYSLNTLSEKAAIAALRDDEFIHRTVRMVRENKPLLEKELQDMGFQTYPTDGNFLLACSPIPHRTLVEGLKAKGVLIRDFGSKRRLENCVRMTIGTKELNDIMLEKMREVIAECR